MALSASGSVAISTKANPRGFWVSRSTAIRTLWTARPPFPNASLSSCSVIAYDKFPTNNLVPIRSYSCSLYIRLDYIPADGEMPSDFDGAQASATQLSCYASLGR